MSDMIRAVRFKWQAYAHAAEVDGLALTLRGGAPLALPSSAVETTMNIDMSAGPAVVTLYAVKGGVRVSEIATTTVADQATPLLPAPEGLTWEFVVVPPPASFLDGAVLRWPETARPLDVSNGRDSVLYTGGAAKNVSGRPFGVYAVIEFTEEPVVCLPLHTLSAAGGQWAIAAMSNGLLKVMGKQPGQSTDYTVDAPVDAMKGRKVYVLFGWDAQTKKFSVWIDGKLRGEVSAPNGVGFSPTVSPDIQLNNPKPFGFTGQAKFKLHDFALVVDKAPTQADADALYGETVAPGFNVGADDVKVWAEAGGSDFARPGARCLAWLDGWLVELQQVRNNPPAVLRWEGSPPAEAGYGLSALRAELFWDALDKLEPNAVKETTVDMTETPLPRTPATPRAVDGVAHIRRDGSISAELRPDSEVYIGLYGFGPGQLADAAYGKTVRDELISANIGLEAGSILQFPPHLAPDATFDEYWASTASFRQATADAFRLADWTGPWSIPQDDLVRDVALSLGPLMARPDGWLELVVMKWMSWADGLEASGTSRAQLPRFSLGKDECNLAFGPDPAGSGVNLDPINLYGGIRRISLAFRTTKVPFSWPVSGIGKEDRNNKIAWHDPAYSDFVDQYDASGNLRGPWTGTTLRQRAEVLAWAASQRDPARPLALNASLTLGNMVTDQPGGPWRKSLASSSPRLIPGQLWVALGYGASIIRGYSMAQFDHVLPVQSNPTAKDWFELQVRPGSPEYHAFLSSATLVHESSDLILGGERAIPDAGPDFLCGHREGTAGRIFWAVNLSEQERLFPKALLPTWRDASTTIVAMDEFGVQTSSTESSVGLLAPANGVLVMTRRTT